MSDTLTSPSIDDIRLAASNQLDPKRRIALGQFMTPSVIARFMASLFRKWPERITLLDPGAGVGSLSEAFAAKFVDAAGPGSNLTINAYEIESLLAGYLQERFSLLEVDADLRGIKIESEVTERDFIREAAFMLSFGGTRYTHVILNPPYKKIAANSEYRLLLRRLGVEIVNLYTAFLALAVSLTSDGGEIVAIIPRSFCNGTYFRPFRQWLLGRVAIQHIHVFESRKKAFRDDDVLQENIIVRFERGGIQKDVVISTSHDPSLQDYVERTVSFDEVVKPGDEERFIHIPIIEQGGSADLFKYSLAELGISVATGPVVDFRVRDHWLQEPKKGAAPLLYAHHFKDGDFKWPREHKKPNAVLVNDETRKWLMPKGWYTITKRFSSKEERRRIVAHVVDPNKLPFELYGFENHLNVLHSDKHGLSPNLARGLAVFLNSTMVDQYFRTFSGHTQVNATDLRTMLFPSRETLILFGKWAAKRKLISQGDIDRHIEHPHDL